MKSKINTFISLSLLLAVSFASEQRIASLGGNAGFWAEDDQNIYMFPATINNFNIAQIDGNGENAKASFLFGEGAKYGFFMEEGSDHLLNVAYGSGSWGLLLGFDTNSSEVGDTKTSSSDISLGFGLNSGFGELGLNFMTFSADDGSDHKPSSMGFGLNLRREQPIWEFSHMLVNFSFMSGEHVEYMDQDNEKMSLMNLNVDLYRHWALTESTDLLFALGFGYMATTLEDESGNETEMSGIMLPKYTFAVETNLLEWATIRAGVNQHHVLSSTSKMGDTEVKSMGDSDFSLLFGIGANYGGFKLDANLNPGFFVDPVSFITGFNDETIATQFSITYTW